MLLRHNHRDMFGRVIQFGDFLLWTNTYQGYGLIPCKCTGVTTQRIYIERLDTGEVTRVMPINTAVITQQMQANIDGNVGANIGKNIGDGE